MALRARGQAKGKKSATLANSDSVCRPLMAAANCVIGCMCLGNALIMSFTCCGTVERAARSADMASVWSLVGISPCARQGGEAQLQRHRCAPAVAERTMGTGARGVGAGLSAEDAPSGAAT